MRRLISVATAFTLILINLSLYGQSSGWVETIKSTTPAVVTIITDKALGSGFLVDSKGIIATNNHVIAGAHEVEVKMYNGEIYKGAEVLFADPDRDLALVKIAAVDLPTLKLGNSDRISLGEDVLLIGAPVGLEDTVSTGVVSGVRLRDGTRIIQTTAPASHGSSGGPLLNRNGDVIGVMTFAVDAGQNLNFAVSINYLRGALESSPSGATTRLAPLHEQAQPDGKASTGIIVYVFRTFNHIQYSSESVFQSVVDEIMLFLKSEKVPMVNNRVGRIFSSSGRSYSAYELISLSEKAGAEGVLYVTVDRPMSAWLKITARYYDVSGRVLWQEDAQKKSGITSSGSIQSVCQNLETKIRPHLASIAESKPNSKTNKPAMSVTENPR